MGTRNFGPRNACGVVISENRSSGGSIGGPLGGSGGKATLPPVEPSIPVPDTFFATNSPLLGTNLELLIDYSSNCWATNDVIKCSREWISGNTETGEFDDGRPLTLDENGWPTSLLEDQCARTIVLLNTGFPAGHWVLTWEGQGDLAFMTDGTLISSTANRIVYDIPNNTGGGFFISITSTNSQNHLRNLKMKHVNQEFNNDLWHPSFLASIAYYGTIRFMDMQATNNNEIGTWNERAKLTSVRWGDKAGIPVEAMVDLCNKIDARPWFCIPHLADDNYVTQFANIVKTNLKPGLKPYVQYSNEVWNFQFAQAQYALQKGDANTARFGADSAPTWITWYSTQARHIHSIWQTVYGGLGGFTRVVGAWTTYYYMTNQMLSFEGNGNHFDALAIAPYFGGNLASMYPGDPGATTATWTTNQLLDAVEDILESSSFTHMDQNKVIADSYGLELICYEGGQHIVRVGNVSEQLDNALDALVISIQDKPKMGQFYDAMLQAWKERGGGGVFCHFVHAGRWDMFGSWGARPRITDNINNYPKAKSLYEFATANLGAVSNG